MCIRDRPCTVLIIVDAISRKYFTSEVSWLWDIDFEKLADNKIARIVLAGRYCNDLAVRFSYTDIPQERIQVMEEIEGAVEYPVSYTHLDVYKRQIK